MKIASYISINVLPMTAPKPLKSGKKESLKHKNFVKYIAKIRSTAKAKNFKVADAFKVVFIIPVSSQATPKNQVEYIGQPHMTDHFPIEKLIEGIKQALLENDQPVYRVDASKYWGTEPKIFLKNIIVQDFEYLRQIK